MAKIDKRREYAFVRFTKEEFAAVKHMAGAYGITVPAMLKLAFFKRRLQAPMMPRPVADGFVKALQRLSHFMNFVVERFDSSFREGFDPEIQDARAAVLEMKQLMVRSYGNALD